MKTPINYIYLYFFIALYPSNIFSSELLYQFEWLKIPVAKLSLNIGIDNNGNNANFSIFTHGPLKLYRDYYSRGYIEELTDSGWSYNIAGRDRGQPEEKLIVYRPNGVPIIKKFIDDKGVSSIKIDNVLDKGAIDPFSVLLRVTNNLLIYKDCSNEYLVFDRKRRFRVNIERIDKNNKSFDDSIGQNTEVIHCRLTVLDSRAANSRNKLWPFNGESIYVDIWFSKKIGFLPIKIKVKSPIGIIYGNILK